MRLHLTIVCSVVGFLDGLGGSCLAGEFDCAVQLEQFPAVMRKGGQVHGWYSAVCYIPSGLETTLSDCWPLSVYPMALSRAPNCGMFDALYSISVVSTGVESGWIAISSDMSGEQFGKHAKWHNITTCSSVDFAAEASTLIWSYFSRHGDGCPSFGECINVECSDFDVFWVNRGWVGHADNGLLLLLSGHFGPLEATMHWAWHGHLWASQPSWAE